MSKFNTLETQSPDEAPLDPMPLDAIGRALRAHYDGLLREPLPARFEDLLARLEAGEAPTDSGKPPPKSE